MKLRSYAKINLTLDILGKREDGYHDIETVFQHVDLYDEILLTELPTDIIEIECNVSEIENSNNLAYKAALLIKEELNIKKGIRIKIDKRIPIGAGLSGGSSNAAAVLKGLNYVWDLGLSEDELISLSRKLGMDVAFHILGGTCVGRGRGDILERIKDFDKHYLVIVYPGFEVSSRDAYSELDYAQIGGKKATSYFIRDFSLSLLHNDFEDSILQRFPKLRELKDELGENALLSGSGSSVYGIFNDKIEAKKIYDKLLEKYSDVFLTETLNKRMSLATEMGFCFGVKKAIDGILSLDKEKVYVLGKLIHNPQVISRLWEQGVRMIEEYGGIDEGTIVISAHGVSDDVIDDIKSRGLKVVDYSCPLVKKVHNVTKEEEKAGRKIIVFGDEKHPEVKGIVGNLHDYKVVSSMDDLKEGDLDEDITLVSQTTRDMSEFNKLADEIKRINEDVKIIDTICSATKARREAAINLAKESDIVIVIGGKISSNTKTLWDICSQVCQTEHTESKKDIKFEWFLDNERVGVTAGASTPDWIIKEVVDQIRLIL